MDARQILRYIFLALLFIFTVIHLIDSWRDDKKRRKYTKPFLLIFIIAYYIVSADSLSVLLILALATSWLGDVLLIPEGNAWFTAGGISFMFTHFLFIALYATNLDFRSLPWLWAIPAAVVYYGIAAVIIYKLKPTTPKMMLIPMYLYLLSNSTMNVFSLMQLVTLRSPGALIAYIGALLFFVSDCTLFLVRYYRNPEIVFKKHFTVMLTYVVGEFLITQGVLMLG